MNDMNAQSRPRYFWATAPGTPARAAEEKIARHAGYLDNMHELKSQTEAAALALRPRR